MKRFIHSLLIGTLILGLFSGNALASGKVMRASVLDADDVSATDFEAVNAADTAEAVETFMQVDDYCGFEQPEEEVIDADLVTARHKFKVELGEKYQVKVFLKNTGNVPWFSDESRCDGVKMFIGTERERDRASAFYHGTVNKDQGNNWVQPNRVAMDQLRVDPGKIASFTFWSIAPGHPNVYKEYFAPVAEGIQWVDNAEFSVTMMFGDPIESMVDLRKKMTYAGSSGSVMEIDLNAEKRLYVDLSEQTVTLYLGDYEVRTFRVSTGKAKTPTPTGDTRIILKQEVRVGYEPPHYIMPKYMMFRAGGYGFHALPSLANDRGVFWTEALNHIGIPVSHGCIRLLPADANFMYDFTDVGTLVQVRW